MSFISYLTNPYTAGGLIGLFVVCAFAWSKGGPAERLGTLFLAVDWLATDAFRAVSGESVPVTILFVSDLTVSLCFLYVAIRYSSAWLGAAMLSHASMLAAHAMALSDPSRPRWHGMYVYLLANNVLSYLTLLALAGGTAATILKRRSVLKRRAEAEAKSAARPKSLAAAFIAQQPPRADRPSATPAAAIH